MKKDKEVATIKDVKTIVQSAVDTILVGMDNLVKLMATKEDLSTMATKEDLSTMATKEDLSKAKRVLKNEVRYVREDIKGINAELSTTVTKKEFSKLIKKVDKYHPLN